MVEVCMNESMQDEHSDLVDSINVVAVFMSLVDIDECSLGTDRCTQDCINTQGSYTCSCHAGYALQSDQYTCEGMCVSVCVCSA